jgi:hypothetical protein
LEHIHEYHLAYDYQGEEVDNRNGSEALYKDEHVRVPILPSEHCKDENEAVEEIFEIHSSLIVVLVCKELHSEKNVDKHEKKEED